MNTTYKMIIYANPSDKEPVAVVYCDDEKEVQNMLMNNYPDGFCYELERIWTEDDDYMLCCLLQEEEEECNKDIA